MNTELIFCPACNHKLRVPADLMGERVQCPKCAKEFMAPPPRPREDAYSSEPLVRRPLAMSAEDELRAPRLRDDRDWTDPYPPPPRARVGIVAAPGIALIVVGVLTLLSNAYTLAMVLTNPAQMRQQVQQIQGMFPGGGGPMPFDPVEMIKVTSSVFIVISLVQIIGGVCMATRKGYAVAIIGAVLAIINCNNVLICLPSFAVGIWAIVVLMLPGVRALFFHPAGTLSE